MSRLRSHSVSVNVECPRAGLAHVYEKCEELMEWIDKDFLWTHIAVTKNFVVRKFCSLLILLDILFLLLIEL